MFSNLFNLTVWLSLILNCFLIGFSVVLLYFHKNLPPEVPLWYSLTWGKIRLASPAYLWLIPSLSFAFLLLNIVTAFLTKQKYLILSKIIVGSSLLVALFLTFSLYKILITVG